MAALPSLYMPLPDWLDTCQLGMPEQGSQQSNGSLPLRKNSMVALTPVQSSSSMSSTASTAPYSGPSTPADNSVHDGVEVASYFGHMTFTPLSETDEYDVQASPCVQPNHQSLLNSGITSNQAHWQSMQYFAPSAPVCLRSEHSTPSRTRGSFVPDVSSFSCSTSALAAEEDGIQYALSALEKFPGGNGLVDGERSESVSPCRPIRSSPWMREFLDHNSDTVNPCSLHDTCLPCGLQSSKPLSIPLGGHLANDSFPNAPLTDYDQRDTPYSSIEMIDGSSNDESPLKRSPGPSLRSPKPSQSKRRRGNVIKRRERKKEPVFIERSGLRVEATVYEETRGQHPCSQCGSFFGRAEHLKRHEKSKHDEARPHRCSLSLLDGDDWHKQEHKKKALRKGVKRSDNLNQHYLTHLTCGEGEKNRNRNGAAEKLFLYYCEWTHNPTKSGSVIKSLERSLKDLNKPKDNEKGRKTEKPPKKIIEQPDHKLQETHPLWQGYLHWLETDGTLESLGYVEGETVEDETVESPDEPFHSPR